MFKNCFITVQTLKPIFFMVKFGGFNRYLAEGLQRLQLLCLQTSKSVVSFQVVFVPDRCRDIFPLPAYSCSCILVLEYLPTNMLLLRKRSDSIKLQSRQLNIIIMLCTCKSQLTCQHFDRSDSNCFYSRLF